MSLLDINLSDRQDLKVLEDNSEVQLRIARAEITPNRSDPSRNNLAITFDVPSEPLADDIRVWIPIPSATMQEENPKQHSKQMNRIAEFCNAFKLEPPIDTGEMLGLEGWAILREEEGLDGNMQNSVRRYIVQR